MAHLNWIELEENGKMICRRCETSYAPSLPISINLFEALLKAFKIEHLSCEKDQGSLVK